MAAISSAPQPHAASSESSRSRDWVTRLILKAALIAGDLLAISGAAVGVFLWYLGEDLNLQAALQAAGAGAWQTALAILWLACLVSFTASGLYTIKRGTSRVDELFKVMVALSLGIFATLIVNTLLPQAGRSAMPASQQALIALWAGAILATSLLRLVYRMVIATLRRHGVDTRRVLIIGAREPGRLVNATIRREPELGYRVQGFLSDTTPVGSEVDGVPVLGRVQSLARVIRATRANEVIIALTGRTPNDLLDIIALAEDQSVAIKLYPDAFHLITNHEVLIGDVSGLPLISVRNVALDNPINRWLKRTLDLSIAFLVLTLTSPVMLLIALLIKLESAGPVFFAQMRVGLDGKPFPTLKFRTMRQNAPALANWTTKDDPRVTAMGRFLRRYSLDELPQFFNVIRGEMSVVGPRPEQPVWVEKFAQSIPRYMLRHKQKAGITGWAQVNGLRGDTSIEERTRYDLYYVENWSLLFDLKIIIKTIVDILTGRNQGY